MKFWEDVQTKNNLIKIKDMIKDLHIKVLKEQNVINRSCQGWSVEFGGPHPDQEQLDQDQGHDQGPPYQGPQIAKCHS